jgi:hypothetical protein
MLVKDHWRITTHAIQLEMERLAGLLQKSAQFHVRTSSPHSLRERNDVRPVDSNTTEPIIKPKGALLQP